MAKRINIFISSERGLIQFVQLRDVADYIITTRGKLNGMLDARDIEKIMSLKTAHELCGKGGLMRYWDAADGRKYGLTNEAQLLYAEACSKEGRWVV